MSRWPLTGRAEELALVGELTRRNSGPAGVVLVGAAGVSKTRLAREALAAARERGVQTRWAAATASARALPLGAFAGLAGAAGPKGSRFTRRAAEALIAGAGRAGVLIAVDDAHLLDAHSAAVVHRLATGRSATLLLTLRTGEPAPDAVTALCEHLRRVELQPLSAAETATLLEAALDGPVDRGAARRLWRITGGNALYLRQLVDGERDAGRLIRVVGVWRWAGRPALSPGLAELVSDRIGALADPEREVIDVLAFAEPLEPGVLHELCGADAVARVVGRGLVEIVADGDGSRARLGHPLVGEVQRSRCGLLRARRLRGEIAAALAAAGACGPDDVLRRAVLVLDSDLPGDPELFTVTARRAAGVTVLVLADRLARAAIAAGGGFEARLTLACAWWACPGARTPSWRRRSRTRAATPSWRSPASCGPPSCTGWRPAPAPPTRSSSRPRRRSPTRTRPASSPRSGS